MIRNWLGIAIRLTALGALAASMTHCTPARSGMNGATNDPGIGANAIPASNFPATAGKIGDLLNSGNTGLSQADQGALGNLLGNLAPVEPQSDPTLLSQALQAQLAELAAEEKQGLDVTAKKIALAGQVLQSCADQIAKYAPRPGQTLLGTWHVEGRSCGTPGDVAVGYIPPNPPLEHGLVYQMQGPLQALVYGRADGYGLLAHPNTSTERRNGVLLDHPPVQGQAEVPGYRSGYYNYDGCTYDMKMTSSQNPIPGFYAEGMKLAAKCFGNALLLLDPNVDKLFQDMDPQLADLLKNQLFGI